MPRRPGPPATPEGWNQRYIDGRLPWDTGRHDVHLEGVLDAYAPTGRALEVGCGTGTNSIYMAARGLSVTALDVADTAIAMARDKAHQAGVAVHFATTDFLTEPVSGAPFAFAYDRGCFHTQHTPEDRARFAGRLARLMDEGGVWHSLLGSTDGPLRQTGPPRRSALEVITAVEPHFELLELRSVSFDEDRFAEARAWVMVARRR